MKVTILQKGKHRYTFVYDESKPEDSKYCLNGRRKINHEWLLQVGGSWSSENVSKEDGNEFYKKLIADGYHKFRNAHEVSWYATIENSSPFPEEWRIEGLYLIPVQSRGITYPDTWND